MECWNFNHFFDYYTITYNTTVTALGYKYKFYIDSCPTNIYLDIYIYPDVVQTCELCIITDLNIHGNHS